MYLVLLCTDRGCKVNEIDVEVAIVILRDTILRICSTRREYLLEFDNVKLDVLNLAARRQLLLQFVHRALINNDLLLLLLRNKIKTWGGRGNPSSAQVFR